MKKVILMLAIMAATVFSMNAQVSELEVVEYFEVLQTTNTGSKIVESYELPSGSEFFIYKENGVSYLGVKVPEGSNYHEPYLNNKLRLNVVDFKVM